MRNKQISLVAIAIGATVLATAVTGKERVLVYATIDVPGATRTSPQGINSKGDISGGFVDSAGQQHGFLLRDGVFTKIDYPGAEYTDARGLNSRGEIVGAYRMPGEPSVNRHGYLRTRHGEFLAADFPGHTSTIPQRITASGLILGCRHEHELMETMRGVTLNARDPGEFTETDAFASMHTGATPDGSLIVGLFTDMDAGRRRGYLLYGDTFIPFDVPGSRGTQAWDLNPRGAVVGVYRTQATEITVSFGTSSDSLPSTTRQRPLRARSGSILAATSSATMMQPVERTDSSRAECGTTTRIADQLLGTIRTVAISPWLIA